MQWHAFVVYYQDVKVTKENQEDLTAKTAKVAKKNLELLFESSRSSRASRLTAFTQHDLLNRAADYFAQARKPRAEWKKLDDLAAQLAEFELRCEAGDYDTAASVLTDIDVEYLHLWGHYRLMIDLHEKLQGKISDSTLTRISAGNLGMALQFIGQVRKSIEYFQKALESARENKNRQGEGAWLGNLGLAYADLGQARKAIEYYEQALLIAREISDRKNEGADLGNLGSAYAALGEARKAIEYYEQALLIAREISDRKNEGNHLGNLGSAYAALGEARKAIEFHEQALLIAREIGDKNTEAKVLMNIGQVYLREGLEDEKAKLLFEQSLAIHEQTEDMRGKAHNLCSLGMLAYIQNRDDEARNYYQQAQEIAMQIEARSLLAVIKLFCAPLDGIALGKEEAIQLANEAKEAFTEMGMNVLDEQLFTRLLEMFASGKFPE